MYSKIVDGALSYIQSSEFTKDVVGGGKALAIGALFDTIRSDSSDKLTIRGISRSWVARRFGAENAGLVRMLDTLTNAFFHSNLLLPCRVIVVKVAQLVDLQRLVFGDRATLSIAARERRLCRLIMHTKELMMNLDALLIQSDNLRFRKDTMESSITDVRAFCQFLMENACQFVLSLVVADSERSA